MTIPMVERVARVISEGLGENPDAPHMTLGGAELLAWQQHEALARAAIEAMREPTHHMTFNAHGLYVSYEKRKLVFKVMIDAALKEPLT